MYICILIGNLLLNLHFSAFEALQQAHLLNSMGHNRQPSDSVDRFVSRDEAAELGDPENKVRRLDTGLLSILSSHEGLKPLWLLSAHHASGFLTSGFLLSCVPCKY